jgi:hypothetical protein
MIVSLEKLKDTNEVIGRRKSKKDKYYKGQKKRTKGQTMIFQNTTPKIKNRSSNTNPTKYLV